jgi:hypothetical protein
MTPVRRVLLLFPLMASLAAAGGQPPATQPPAGKKDPQSSYEPRSAPGAGQKFLEQFAGDWTVAKTFHPRQGGPVTTAGTCRQEMIHGGRFLRSEFTFDGPTGATTGTGVIGFEADSGLFTSTWIDSRSTRVSIRKSKDKFEGKEIVLYSRALDDAIDRRSSRTVTKLEDDGAKIVHRQYTSGDDGKERVIMELILTRKPAAPRPGGR